MVTVGIIFVLIVIIAVLANGIEDYNSKNTIKFDESFGELQLPIITFLNNDKEFNFLVDTGANMSIINSYYLQEFKYTSLETTGTIFGMEGNITNTNFVSIVLQKSKDSFLNYIISKCNNMSKPLIFISIIAVIYNALSIN